MRKIINLLIILSFAISAFAHNDHAFVIKGKAEAGITGKVYFAKMGKDAGDVISADIKNGKFEIKGTYDKVDFYKLYTDDMKANRSYVLVVLDNSKLSVDLKKDVFSCVVKGSKANDQRTALQKNVSKYTNEQKAIEKEFMTLSKENKMTKEIKGKLIAKFQASQKKSMKATEDFIIKNPTSMVNAFILGTNINNFKVAELAKYSSKFTKETKETGIGKYVIEYVEKMQKTAEGQKFTDFKMKNLEGKEIKLSTYVKKNKVTIVDFWASWCGPCVAAMPHIKELYKKYHKKGLEIVGVSFDQKEASWRNKVKELDLPWIHMSDLKGWKSEASGIYGINSIPHLMIINQKGIIVSRGLHGKELDDKLAELFK